MEEGLWAKPSFKSLTCIVTTFERYMERVIMAGYGQWFTRRGNNSCAKIPRIICRTQGEGLGRRGTTWTVYTDQWPNDFKAEQGQHAGFGRWRSAANYMAPLF